MDEEKIEALLKKARPLSTKMAEQICDVANKQHKDDIMPFAGTAGSLVFQTVLISIAVGHFEPGSAEGEAWLSQMYHSALKDAMQRWKRPDLKQFSKRH